MNEISWAIAGGISVVSLGIGFWGGRESLRRTVRELRYALYQANQECSGSQHRVRTLEDQLTKERSNHSHEIEKLSSAAATDLDKQQALHEHNVRVIKTRAATDLASAVQAATTDHAREVAKLKADFEVALKQAFQDGKESDGVVRNAKGQMESVKKASTPVKAATKEETEKIPAKAKRARLDQKMNALAVAADKAVARRAVKRTKGCK